MSDGISLACPVPGPTDDTVQLAHGGGGRVMARLLDEIIRPVFADAELDRKHDGAVLEIDGPLAFTTDSYVVQPLEFPGGNIGSIAINGTINDLAMCGARPNSLSVSLILEEGLPLATLRRILVSMRNSATAAGVRVVTGDTKVVDRGKADGMFVTTAGVGRVVAPTTVGPEQIRPGDVVILSGDIGRHGIAVLAAREGLGFEPAIESDCAPLAEPVMALIDAGITPHCMRDLTRGGLASALVELAEASRLSIAIDEATVPVPENVTAACELLGFDPLYVANEGRFIAILAPDEADPALVVLRRSPTTAAARVIGTITDGPAASVACRGLLGATRTIDMLSGEQMPRIC